MSDRIRQMQRRDEGFTLIEILVALVLFALMTTAIVPMLITSLRASTVAKMDTGARQLTQERFETLRNLPYSVAPTVSASVTTNVPDLLDQYYPNGSTGLVAADVESSGYVSAGARRAGEPTTGAFYRTVFSPVPGHAQYNQYVAVQFLDANGVSVTPPSTWSAASASAQPPSLSVGVTVSTKWFVGELSKSFTSFTEIGQGRSEAPIVIAQARSSAVRISSTYGGSDLVLEGGVLNSDASVTTGSAAAVNGQGAFAQLVPGLRVDGVTRGATAPPEATVVDVSDTAGRTLIDSASRVLARFGSTHVKRVRASTAGGDVETGSVSNAVTSSVNVGAGFSFDNAPAPTDAALGLASSVPVVRASDSTSGSQIAETAGRSRSTGGGSKSVETVTSQSVAQLDVLPVELDGMSGPMPLIKVSLSTSNLRCLSSPTARALEVTYTGSLSYLVYDPVGSTYSYVTKTLAGTNATDPLSAVDLRIPTATTPNVGIVVGKSGTRLLYLGEYLTSLRSIAQDNLTSTYSIQARRLEASIPGLISMSTVPLRSEALSAVTVELGRHSCVAQDNR